MIVVVWLCQMIIMGVVNGIPNGQWDQMLAQTGLSHKDT